MEAEWQQRSASPVGEKAEVADAHEAAWQQVEQEAAQELVDRQSQEPLLVGVRGVSPAEGDVALLEGDESAVGDGDAMGVATEIAQRMFRSAEGWLGIDDPVVAEQGSEPGGEASWFRQWRKVAVEGEPVLVERRLQSGDELAAKDSAEHLDRKKERVAWLDPTRAIGRKSTGRHNAMHMWMKFEFLTPGVQHAEEANFCAKMLGISGNFEKWQHFDMLPGDPLTASFDECVSRSANQIGHLEEWPVHLHVLWWRVF